jgi:hypothetical protein
VQQQRDGLAEHAAKCFEFLREETRSAISGSMPMISSTRAPN